MAVVSRKWERGCWPYNETKGQRRLRDKRGKKEKKKKRKKKQKKGRREEEEESEDGNR